MAKKIYRDGTTNAVIIEDTVSGVVEFAFGSADYIVQNVNGKVMIQSQDGNTFSKTYLLAELVDPAGVAYASASDAVTTIGGLLAEPASGGGGGDATAANQTTQITAANLTNTNLDTVNTTLSSILAGQTDGNSNINIVDPEGDYLMINPDGSINVNATVTGGGDATAANQVIQNDLLTDIKAQQTNKTQWTNVDRILNNTSTSTFFKAIANDDSPFNYFSAGDILRSDVYLTFNTFDGESFLSSLSTQWSNVTNANAGIAEPNFTLIEPWTAAINDVTTTVTDINKSFRSFSSYEVTTSGSTLGEEFSISFTTSSDFVGTINGVTRKADITLTIEADIQGLIPPINYTITAGSIIIDRLTV